MCVCVCVCERERERESERERERECVWERECDTAESMNPVITMGWLRLVGSLKLYVSFAEYCLFYRALL